MRTTDERYMVEITTENTEKAEIKTYSKADRWARVENNRKYSSKGRSNAKYTDSDGCCKTFSHVTNACCAALKFANGGTWDFDPSYQR